MLNDKDFAGFADILTPLAEEIVLTQPESDRAAPVTDLLSAVRRTGFGGGIRAIRSLSEALAVVSEEMKDKEGFVLVTGSLYLMGRAREFLKLATVEGDVRLTDSLDSPRKETV
jgi:dihydrofolate synthase/folylpolyglutamate synthase